MVDNRILELIESALKDKVTYEKAVELVKEIEEKKRELKKLEDIIRRLLDGVETQFEHIASLDDWKDYGIDSEDLGGYYKSRFVAPYQDKVDKLKDEIQDLKKERLSIEILKDKLGHWIS